MPSEGPNNAGSGSGSGWTDPGNITALDSTVATFDVAASDFSTALLSGDYAFALPSTATVSGIEVSVRRSAGGDPGVLHDYLVRLTKDGSGSVGDDNADPSFVDNSGFEVITYGGPLDLWGETWTYSEINASTFGVFLGYQNDDVGSSQQVQIDSVQITVYFTDAEPIEGDGGVEFPASQLSGSGGIPYSGSGGIAPPAAVLAGSGTHPYSGSGGVAFGAVLAGAGQIPILGSGSITFATALAGTGTLTIQGTGGVSFASALFGLAEIADTARPLRRYDHFSNIDRFLDLS